MSREMAFVTSVALGFFTIGIGCFFQYRKGRDNGLAWAATAAVLGSAAIAAFGKASDEEA